MRHKRKRNEQTAYLKYFDTQQPSELMINQVLLFSSLVNVPQGHGASERVGLEVLVRSINIRGYIIGRSATDSRMARILLVLDRQSNRKSPIAGEVLDNLSDPFLSFINMSYSRRFMVLASERVRIPKRGTGVNAFAYFEISKKLRTRIRFTTVIPAPADSPPDLLFQTGSVTPIPPITETKNDYYTFPITTYDDNPIDVDNNWNVHVREITTVPTFRFGTNVLEFERDEVIFTFGGRLYKAQRISADNRSTGSTSGFTMSRFSSDLSEDNRLGIQRSAAYFYISGSTIHTYSNFYFNDIRLDNGNLVTRVDAISNTAVGRFRPRNYLPSGSTEFLFIPGSTPVIRWLNVGFAAQIQEFTPPLHIGPIRSSIAITNYIGGVQGSVYHNGVIYTHDPTNHVIYRIDVTRNSAGFITSARATSLGSLGLVDPNPPEGNISLASYNGVVLLEWFERLYILNPANLVTTRVSIPWRVVTQAGKRTVVEYTVRRISDGQGVVFPSPTRQQIIDQYPYLNPTRTFTYQSVVYPYLDDIQYANPVLARIYGLPINQRYVRYPGHTLSSGILTAVSDAGNYCVYPTGDQNIDYKGKDETSNVMRTVPAGDMVSEQFNPYVMRPFTISNPLLRYYIPTVSGISNRPGTILYTKSGVTNRLFFSVGQPFLSSPTSSQLLERDALPLAMLSRFPYLRTRETLMFNGIVYVNPYYTTYYSVILTRRLLFSTSL